MQNGTVKCEICGTEILAYKATEWVGALPGRKKILVCPKCDLRAERQVQGRTTIRAKMLKKRKEWSK